MREPTALDRRARAHQRAPRMSWRSFLWGLLFAAAAAHVAAMSPASSQQASPLGLRFPTGTSARLGEQGAVLAAGLRQQGAVLGMAVQATVGVLGGSAAVMAGTAGGMGRHGTPSLVHRAAVGSSVAAAYVMQHLPGMEVDVPVETNAHGPTQPTMTRKRKEPMQEPEIVVIDDSDDEQDKLTASHAGTMQAPMVGINTNTERGVRRPVQPCPLKVLPVGTTPPPLRDNMVIRGGPGDGYCVPNSLDRIDITSMMGAAVGPGTQAYRVRQFHELKDLRKSNKLPSFLDKVLLAAESVALSSNMEFLNAFLRCTPSGHTFPAHPDSHNLGFCYRFNLRWSAGTTGGSLDMVEMKDGHMLDAFRLPFVNGGFYGGDRRAFGAEKRPSWLHGLPTQQDVGEGVFTFVLDFGMHDGSHKARVTLEEVSNLLWEALGIEGLVTGSAPSATQAHPLPRAELADITNVAKAKSAVAKSNARNALGVPVFAGALAVGAVAAVQALSGNKKKKARKEELKKMSDKQSDYANAAHSKAEQALGKHVFGGAVSKGTVAGARKAVNVEDARQAARKQESARQATYGSTSRLVPVSTSGGGTLLVQSSTLKGVAGNTHASGPQQLHGTCVKGSCHKAAQAGRVGQVDERDRVPGHGARCCDDCRDKDGYPGFQSRQAAWYQWVGKCQPK